MPGMVPPYADARCDVLVVGGGCGGVAAALAACSMGRRVVLTDPYPWLGGQLTSQMVPPDEHRWIESEGATARYRTFRELVRQLSREALPLTSSAAAEAHLNPGGGDVSRLCVEPKLAAATVHAMLAPHVGSGRLDVRRQVEPVAAEVERGRVVAVSFSDGSRVEAEWILDATETGDLLPMTRCPCVLGGDNEDDVQAITWCAAAGFERGVADDRHVIDRPATYDRWRAYVPEMDPPYFGPLLGWKYADRNGRFTGEGCMLPAEDGGGERYSLFKYRQVRDASKWSEPTHDATILNWPQNDYWLGKVVDEPADVAAARYEESRELTRSLVYWLQTEAPRHDGVWEAGYPELFLWPELAGTDDGLAMAPYHREGRRLVARRTIETAHVTGDSPTRYDDSVGVGAYRLDLHPSCAGRGSRFAETWAFEIPLGALLPADGPENLVAAGKCLGTTHETNGCYRLHPVEWNVGEAAGVYAAMNAPGVEQLQYELSRQGVQLRWDDPQRV